MELPPNCLPRHAPWSALLPSGVASVVGQSDDPAVCGYLLDGEAAYVARAVEKRRREFAVGRHCLRTALAAFGRPIDKPIPVGNLRAPALESTYVGAISHCKPYVVAVAGRAHQFLGIGVDVEKNTPLEPGVEQLICTPNELEHLTAFSVSRAVSGFDPKKLVFSIKESFYKAYAAQVNCYFDFQDAEVTLSSTSPSWELRLRRAIGNKALDPKIYRGYYMADAEYLYTAVAIGKLHSVDAHSIY